MRRNLRGQTVRPPKPERFQAEFDGDTDGFSDTFIRSGGGEVRHGCPNCKTEVPDGSKFCI
jgi:hypothetical protein